MSSGGGAVRCNERAWASVIGRETADERVHAFGIIKEGLLEHNRRDSEYFLHRSIGIVGDDEVGRAIAIERCEVE
jgi:hypothetical protein